MNFRIELEHLTKLKLEISDLKNLNIEWYDDLTEWKNCIWSWVNKLEPYKTRESIATLKASILELEDNVTLQRFRDAGSKPTYHYISLEKLKYFLDKGNYTHIFLFGIGELDKKQVLELHLWIKEKLL